MIGKTVGKYKIVDKLGRGGMGTVFKAVDETLDREVADKSPERRAARRGGGEALPRGGDHAREAQSSAHRDDLRARTGRRRLLMVMEFVAR